MVVTHRRVSRASWLAGASFVLLVMAGPCLQAKAEDATAAIDIPPPDLPPVEVVIDVPRPAPDVQVVLPEWPPDVGLPVIAVAPARDLDAEIVAALKARFEGARTPGSAAEISKRDRELVAAFYQARDYKPLFVDEAGLTPLGREIESQIATADQDGLDAAAYPLPSLIGGDAGNLGDAEWLLASAAFAYARDARGGRIVPARLSNLITPELNLPSPGDVLGKLAASEDGAAVLAAYQPQHVGYKALRDKLAELREATGAVQSRPAIGEGRPLRIGMNDPRVPALRARLGLPASPDETFDEQIAVALADWQRSQGLRPTGRLDRGMAGALDGRTSRGVSAADIVANMERWRWLPQDLGERRVEVNLPEFTLRVLDEQKVVHQARVVVGKPETPTPLFSNAVQFVVVNPYWNIPPSILKKEILPKLAQDPTYAAAHGYEVIQRGNSISVRQPPGERNALGFIKFLFPNQHSVYLHDTPSRALFARDRRAFSHGCVRVDQPFRFGEVVLGADGYDEQRLRRMVGKGERTIRLKQPLPIHLTYFTLRVDENGRLQRLDDLYGYDGRVKTALGINPNGLRYATLKTGQTR
jgi:murein L,D-transpeptidase YcbB/YkuD